MIKDIQTELKVFDCITFEEKAHKYHINNIRAAGVSVTGLIGKYKPKFEEDKWARIKAKKLGISVEEMKFIWSEKNLFSTTLGTAFHYLAECAYTKMPYKFKGDEIVQSIGEEAYVELRASIVRLAEQFKAFYRDTESVITSVRNELIVGDIHDTRVCGTLDMLVYNKEQKCLEIYDFKTNKNITYSNVFNEYYKPPMQKMQVCEFNTYCLQLSIYKLIIEKYTNLKIKNLKIVWFNSQNPTYQIITCKDYSTYVSQMLAEVV